MFFRLAFNDWNTKATYPFDFNLNLQAKEESESWDVEVPLGPEQPHVHLDLSVEVGSVCVLTVFLRGQFNKFLTLCKKGVLLVN